MGFAASAEILDRNLSAVVPIDFIHGGKQGFAVEGDHAVTPGKLTRRFGVCHRLNIRRTPTCDNEALVRHTHAAARRHACPSARPHRMMRRPRRCLRWTVTSICAASSRTANAVPTARASESFTRTTKRPQFVVRDLKKRLAANQPNAALRFVQSHPDLGGGIEQHRGPIFEGDPPHFTDTARVALSPRSRSSSQDNPPPRTVMAAALAASNCRRDIRGTDWVSLIAEWVGPRSVARRSRSPHWALART